MARLGVLEVVGTGRTHLLVDGVDLLHHLDARGSYGGLPGWMERGRAGLPWVRDPGGLDEVALLAVCTCGEWGCGAIACEVSESDDAVVWHHVRPVTAASSTPAPLPAFGPVFFDRAQYEQAFASPHRASAPPPVL